MHCIIPVMCHISATQPVFNKRDSATATLRVLIFATNIISASYVTQISYYIRFLESHMCYLFILFDTSSVEHRE